MKTIEEILIEIREDKHENLSTTSKKFKEDVWNFFKSIPESKHYRAVEYGTHKGQTTRVLSYLFDKVYTINLPNHFDQAMALNADRDNIEYKALNLYGTPLDELFSHKPVNVHFIDAGHEFDQVMSDFSRALCFERMTNFEGDELLPVYFIFDDYGQASRNVFRAVNELFKIGQLEKVCYIGHPPRHSFGGQPERILADHEGIICKLVD